jgi:hypothetical protein
VDFALWGIDQFMNEDRLKKAVAAFEAAKSKLYNKKLGWGEYFAAVSESDDAYRMLQQAASEPEQEATA